MSESTKYLRDDSFLNLDNSLKQLDFSQTEITEIYRLVATILHIRNLLFEEDSEAPHKCKLSHESEFTLQTISKMMGIESTQLKRKLLSREIRFGKQNKENIL